MRARWQGNCLWAVALLVLSGGCRAQSVTPEDEYKQLIKVNQNIQPLGAHPFGENISLYDGTLSFEETDVSLTGNGPAISLGRTLTPAQGPGYALNAQRPFGDWDLDIPRIETSAGSASSLPNAPVWQVANGPTAGRCTYFNVPPNYTQGTEAWAPKQWWYGYHLIVPGQGSQTLLPRGTQNTLTPTISGMSFPIVTKQNWMISCGVTASDGGEGFLAIAPDGTRYTFAHLVYRPMANVTAPLGTAPAVIKAGGGLQPMAATENILYRRDAIMYVTQIQDRFGNTLTYDYDATTGYLTKITSSDQRELDITYVSGTPLIHTVTVQPTSATPRTWTYSYDTTTNPVLPTLKVVQLPDTSTWSYELGAFQTAAIDTDGGDCGSKTLPLLSSTAATGYITQPSGLTATFTLTPMLHGRSDVPWQCYGSGGSGGDAPYSTFPEYYYQFSLTSEVLSGAGMPTETWTYSYSPANESWSNDACASSGTCATTVYTDVTDPDGNDTHTTFSNVFDATEGQLKRTDYYSGSAASGTLMRSVANLYASPTGGPWPAAYGVDLQGRDNQAQTVTVSPLQQRTITQDGQNYVWYARTFDPYTQPTDVERIGQSTIEETTGYLNDSNLWVLGLPQTVTNVTNPSAPEVESLNTYDPSNDTLKSRARFGETLMSYTWYTTGAQTAGQLETFTDGNGHTTTLSNYYRGIPTSILYPATTDFPSGTSETLAVDDLGEITAITDQAGHTTGYKYDPVGRVAEIDYPYDSSVDSAQWYPKKFSYTPPASTPAERGLAAGHWRRTITQGSTTDTTYFDAELRPVLDDTSNGSADISAATGYDWRGLTTFASYPASGSLALSDPGLATGTHSNYDALGRLHQTLQDSEQGTLTTTTLYLPGPGTQVTDPRLKVTTTYDQAFDQPVYNVPLSISAPEGVSQSITRNIYGEPTAITQSGSYGTESDSVTKTLVYDSYHRLCRTTEPETGSTVMAYDGANNLLWSAEGIAVPSNETDCAQNLAPAAAQTVRSYDAMNRVQTIAPPAGTQSTTYHYDALGHVHTAVSGVATQGFAYNSLGLLTGESLQVDGFTWALGYGYDAYGHRATVSYPAGTGTSEVVAYAPDAWGRPTQAGSYVTGVGYYPDGHVSGFNYLGGASYVAEENARHLVSNFSDGTVSALALSEDLAYDPNGNLTTVTDLVNGTRSKSFQFDDLNRLTNATAANLYGTESYTYDPINNLRTRLTQGQTNTYNYDATNKLTSITQGTGTVESLGYNPQGDVTNDYTSGATLAFDAKHQLTSVAGLESYNYDAAGRRVEKQPTSGSPKYYLYSQAGQLMYQYDLGTATATDFIYLGTKLVGDSTAVQLLQPGGISFGANPVLDGTTLSWGGVPAATSYTLEQSSNGGAWSPIYSGSATSTTVSGLTGGSYVFRVEACIGSTCSAWTTSATLGVWPAIPTITVPTGTIDGPYTVSWTASAGATGYTVQESLNGGLWNTIATNTTATSIDRPGTTTGSYTYQVEASDAYNMAGWSATSAAVNVDTGFGTKPTPVPTLSVPAASNNGSATVSWTAASPVTGYTLKQSSNGGSWVPVYSGTATSATVTGLADGSYTYQLKACNNPADGSVCTGWVTGGTLVVTYPPTSAPSLSVPASSTNGSYTVSWSSVATATSYKLLISSNGGSTWSAAYSGSAMSWGATGQGNGSYMYQVEACNVGGCGPLSATGTTNVLLPPASAPSLSVPANNTTGSYTVSWGTVSTATSYALEISTDSGGWVRVQSSGATSWGASGQTTGTYGYHVVACNTSGCGPWSGTGTVNVLLPPGSAPSLSVPASSTTGSYTVSWGSVATASSYTLQESVNAGSWGVVQSGSATSWSTSGRGDGSYAYRVQASNASGYGPWSGTGTVSVTLPPVLPARPLTLSVSGTTSKPVVHASWATAANATSYQLQMSEGGTTWDQAYNGAGTTWSELIFYSGQVEFQLQACNSVGCSGWSAIQSVTLNSGGGAMATPVQTPTQGGSTSNQATAGEGTP